MLLTKGSDTHRQLLLYMQNETFRQVSCIQLSAQSGRNKLSKQHQVFSDAHGRVKPKSELHKKKEIPKLHICGYLPYHHTQLIISFQTACLSHTFPLSTSCWLDSPLSFLVFANPRPKQVLLPRSSRVDPGT